MKMSIHNRNKINRNDNPMTAQYNNLFLGKWGKLILHLFRHGYGDNIHNIHNTLVLIPRCSIKNIGQ